MPITPLPTPPLRNQTPWEVFADRGDTFLAALPAFVTEANALQTEVNASENAAMSAAVIAVSSAAVAQPAANFKGNWAALSGALAMPASVAHAGAFWALNVPLANVAAAVPGVSASWTRIFTGPEFVIYNSRNTVRAMAPSAGAQAIVQGLGLFVWYAGSTEIDDDETCFATATGRWLLEAASWELVEAWGVVERLDPLGVAAASSFPASFDARWASSFASSFPISFDARFTSKVLTGSASCAISSLSAISSASFTGTVAGAAVGDRVIATPPGQLGSTSADTARLGCHAWVSAANTVTVMLTNASAATATTNSAIRTGWPLTVIKP